MPLRFMGKLSPVLALCIASTAPLLASSGDYEASLLAPVRCLQAIADDFKMERPK